MRVFEMIMRVSAENLTTVLDVLKDNADLISMKQVDEIEAPKKKHRRRRMNGAREGGATTRDLILQAVAGGQITRKQLMKLLEVNGFAPTSAGPAVNELVRGGKVKKISEGVYGAA